MAGRPFLPGKGRPPFCGAGGGPHSRAARPPGGSGVLGKNAATARRMAASAQSSPFPKENEKQKLATHGPPAPEKVFSFQGDCPSSPFMIKGNFPSKSLPPPLCFAHQMCIRDRPCAPRRAREPSHTPSKRRASRIASPFSQKSGQYAVNGWPSSMPRSAWAAELALRTRKSPRPILTSCLLYTSRCV